MKVIRDILVNIFFVTFLIGCGGLAGYIEFGTGLVLSIVLLAVSATACALALWMEKIFYYGEEEI